MAASIVSSQPLKAEGRARVNAPGLHAIRADADSSRFLEGRANPQVRHARVDADQSVADGVGVNFPFWEMPGTVFGLGFAPGQR